VIAEYELFKDKRGEYMPLIFAIFRNGSFEDFIFRILRRELVRSYIGGVMITFHTPDIKTVRMSPNEMGR
jgi:hypothetical protein